MGWGGVVERAWMPPMSSLVVLTLASVSLDMALVIAPMRFTIKLWRGMQSSNTTKATRAEAPNCEKSMTSGRVRGEGSRCPDCSDYGKKDPILTLSP